MPNYNTPGVYVEEISTLPASIAPVATAIPCFIGYTEKATQIASNDLNLVPTRITSLVEYQSLFGGPKVEIDIKVDLDDNKLTYKGIAIKNGSRRYLMYYAMQMYFANGGGPCYIVSVAGYSSGTVDQATLEDGLAAAARVDEPTLLVIPDLVNISGTLLEQRKDRFYGTYVTALTQCSNLQDRFTIMDAYQNRAYDDALDFTMTEVADTLRDKTGTLYLNYGASYTPYLRTQFPPQFTDYSQLLFDDVTPAGPPNPPKLSLTTPIDNRPLQDVLDEIESATGDGPTLAPYITEAFVREVEADIAASEGIVMGPSAAIAGIYATVDRNRGVWKAPANISLAGVTNPTKKITNDIQDGLNVHSTGKSINAIRNFTGKGTLVWGARTLEGNSNEWRYVNVRRTFIFVEESVKKATEFVVFEPNDANTWNRVRAMITNFLTTVWRDGGLAGAKPEQAFFVNVGLGETMTAQDILEGRLIVEIGMAVVRPAEFIILKFSHKLQEA